MVRYFPVKLKLPSVFCLRILFCFWFGMELEWLELAPHQWGGKLCKTLDLWSEVTHSCLTLCDPMDCSWPGSSVHRISQTRILEWVAISFSKGFSWPRDWTHVSHLAGKFLPTEPPRKPLTQLTGIIYWNLQIFNMSLVNSWSEQQLYICLGI